MSNRLLDNGNSGLEAPLARNVFCPPYVFKTAGEFTTYIQNYFTLGGTALSDKIQFSEIRVHPRGFSDNDYLLHKERLIKAGGFPSEIELISASGGTYASSLTNVAVNADRYVGMFGDDGTVSLWDNCALTIDAGKTLTTNGKITTTGKNLTKKGAGTFALHGLAEVITGNLTIGSTASEISPVSMATNASITGTLTMRPTAKLIVNGNASIGSIVLELAEISHG